MSDWRPRRSWQGCRGLPSERPRPEGDSREVRAADPGHAERAGRGQLPSTGAWYAEIGAWYEKWGATGKLDGGHQLQGTETAKTIRSGSVTDGPFIETKEVLGGYSVIEADSIDEAVEIAKTWPGVDRGWITMEVRPVIEMG